MQQLGEKAVAAHPDKIVHSGGTHVPGEALKGRGCSIILPQEDPASDLGNWEGGLDLLGKFMWVFHPWDGCKFHPPTWPIQVVGPPNQPGFNIYD